MSIKKSISSSIFLQILSISFLFLFSCSNPGYETNNDEFKRTGALVKDISEIDSSRELSFSALSTMPASVDLSYLMPPVGSQGNQGSCVGWAVAFALKTYQEHKEEGWNLIDDFFNPISKNIFSPSWVYNQINGGRDNGAYIESAFDLVKNSGCDTLYYFPYDPSNWTRKPDSASYNRAKNYRAKEWYYLSKNVSSLKSVLVNGNAFVIRLNVYPDFDYISPSNPIYDTVSGSNRGGHALCVVGYDDSLGAFKFINSWGKYWGISGYGWISYNLINNSSVGFQAYYLVDGVNGPYSPYSPPTPYSSYSRSSMNYDSKSLMNSYDNTNF